MPPAKTNRRKKVLATGRRLRFVSAGGWEYVERVNATGVVAIIALTEENELVLTEQYRRPVDARVIDLPAGLVGDIKGAREEDFVAAAQRELMEETGYDARRFELLGQSPTSPGLTSETVAFVRAVGLKRVGTGGGIEDEQIVVHRVKRTRADVWLRSRVAAGIQIDCKVYAGLYYAAKRVRPLRSRRR